jgi:hypothetical protein
MPVQYKDTPYAQSIIDSTKHVRTKAGLFDVSHMCSIRWRGKVRTCDVYTYRFRHILMLRISVMHISRSRVHEHIGCSCFDQGTVGVKASYFKSYNLFFLRAIAHPTRSYVPVIVHWPLCARRGMHDCEHAFKRSKYGRS